MKKEEKVIIDLYEKAVDNLLEDLTDMTSLYALDVVINLVNDSNIDYLYNKIDSKMEEIQNSFRISKPKYLHSSRF